MIDASSQPNSSQSSQSPSYWDIGKNYLENFAIGVTTNPFGMVGGALSAQATAVSQVAQKNGVTIPGAGILKMSAIDIALVVLGVLLIFGVLIAKNKDTIITIAKTAAA